MASGSQDCRYGLEAAASAASANAPSRTEVKTSKRSPMQDFSAYPLYLDDNMWDMIADDKVDNSIILRKIIQMLATDLNLRCPSESTNACLTALLILREKDEEARAKLILNGYPIQCEGSGQSAFGFLQIPQAGGFSVH